MPYLPISKYLLSFDMDTSFPDRLSVYSALNPLVAQSQTAVETEILDDSVSADDREKLLARLSDKEVRDIVWNLIQEKSKHPQADNPLAAELNQLTSNLRSNFEKRIQDIPNCSHCRHYLSRQLPRPERKRIFRDRLSHDRIGHFVWMDRSIPLQENDKSRL